MEHRITARRWLSSLMLAVLLVTAPGVAYAAGSGDDPTPTPDVLTSRESVLKIMLEFQTERLTQADASGSVSAMVIDAPYRFLYTPSHEQERSYWCGPATVQVITDYFGTSPSQSTIASAMGTTTDGTAFSKVDDALRAYTGKSYYYYGGLTGSTFNGKVADTIMTHGWPLAADVTIRASVWPYYNYDHAGHIIPLEAFDWRSNTIRINDVYDEAGSRSGGGNTYGHTTYSRDVIWSGVYAHPQRAVVSAP